MSSSVRTGSPDQDRRITRAMRLWMMQERQQHEEDSMTTFATQPKP